MKRKNLLIIMADQLRKDFLAVVYSGLPYEQHQLMLFDERQVAHYAVVDGACSE